MMFLIAFAYAGCMAQEPRSYTKDYRNALRHGAKVKMTLRIVDDGGRPVSNAVVTMQFNPPKATKHVVGGGNSDCNGVVIAEGLTTKTVPGKVVKDGYYNSWFRFRSGNPEITDSGGESSKIYYDSKVKDGCWLPWNPTIPVVLREIRNPIPMYVSKIYRHSIPSETNMGFDCVAQDWIEPHGKGTVADFIIKFLPLPESGYDRACRIVLSAADGDGGFIRRRKNTSSAFVSDYEAPTNGYAEVSIQREKRLKFYERNPSDLSEDDYLIFKSRIVRDKDGVVVSANYGKIYGKMEYVFSKEQALGAFGFTYYFNPTPNDRNIEFDGRNNLFMPQHNSSKYAP